MNKRGLEVNAEAGSTIEGCQIEHTNKKLYQKRKITIPILTSI
jgi:hypothetical protein